MLEHILDAPLETHDSFLDDAAKGELRDVSWIDPNFADLHVLNPNSNDDHPPADVKAGQALVLELYEALVNSPAWEDTLLVIVYDEHGGFYDHVPPPSPPGSDFPILGLRVPALVIGPRVRRFVCHETFEHTTLIATILSRFASDPEHAVAQMPARVQQAPHLGALLESEPRTDIDVPGELRQAIDSWRIATRQARRGRDGGVAPIGEGAGHKPALHDFQEEFLKFSMAMRDKGLPPTQP